MTLTLEQRRAKNLLEHQLAEIMAPEKAAKRASLAKSRRERRKAIGKTAAGQRKPRQHDNAYLAYTRRQPCILAALDPRGCGGPVEATHLRFSDAKAGRVNPGAGRKPDDHWCLPACANHHRAQHAAGNERRWWSSWGIDPNAECIARYAAFNAKGDA